MRLPSAVGMPARFRVVVAGFSQGGALALLLLRSRLRLAGCVGLSTWLPLAEAGMVLSDEQKNTPVFMAHGTADQVVIDYIRCGSAASWT